MTPSQARSRSRPLFAWTVFGLFALLVALLGGSSRPDAVQILALRPLAALFLAPVLYFWAWPHMRDMCTPFLLLAALTALIAIQLVPLPPGLWQALSGRGPVAELDAALGTAGIWRPLSMVPSRTLDTLASMIVPLTALALIAMLRIRRSALLYTVVALGGVSALLGLLQIAGGDALYFYDSANRGSPIGFFANRNHAAVFYAMTLVTLAYLATAPDLGRRPPWHNILLGVLAVLVLLAALLTGSRAGLLALVLALAAGAGLFRARHVRRTRARQADATEISPVLGLRLALGLGVAAVAGIVVLFFVFDSIPALDRLAEQGLADDMRGQLAPILFEMIGRYGLTGSGFGTFEEVYHISEPAALMLPQYINQAHNDWAQWVIEGGLPAVAIAAGFLVWLVGAMRAIFRGRYGFVRGLHWVTLIAIALSASLVDYPLRIPLFQFAAVLWLAALCRERRRARDGY
ncbi:O-antigen ligase family protein [Pelagerythrobacter sp.]|uniref:O-antigen ligase family protein n=1 Tax=Pelagerythrobacter sp. TaxID=2800702 RepID=UPI0035AE5558